ncbi:MAG TPA: translesion error-prone DNA polymerase V autoproteolytic subunit [Candidatus Syntrophosphaera sp.]|nr:translesion error-prone DNA polymerase V autoproteolytic subunit [Candidatus Syntrophosphaera sp.]
MAKKLKSDGSIKAIYVCDTTTELPRPLVGQHIPAGFPSPAQDYIEGSLDLNKYVIKHPASTFFIRVDGDSMINAGIIDDDIAVVDRSLDATHNRIVVAIYDGELTLKRLRIEDGVYWLCSENPAYKPILVEQDLEFYVWGVVTFVIHKV